MTTVSDVLNRLTELAPMALKMDFDNVGHLVGRMSAPVRKILVSLDITSAVIAEAISTGADLIVSHHPLFFSVKDVTDGTVIGGKILSLAENKIAAICMHTNLDAAAGGVNDALAAAAGIDDVTLLNVEGTLPDGTDYSYGRVGTLKNPVALSDYLETVKTNLRANGLRYHDAGRPVHKIAVVGGSGGQMLADALARGCDTLLTSDIKYDVFLDAKELSINLIDGDHFCTENLVVARLFDVLSGSFPDVAVEISAVHGQTAQFYT
jgi:dinuclear metal center YbgI/SA1388 family protein